jgi:hypothetical protein
MGVDWDKWTISANPLDWFSSQDSLDLEHGDEVLQAFFDAAVLSSRFIYSDYNSFRAASGGDSFVLSLGKAVRDNMHPGLFEVWYTPYGDAAKRAAKLAEDTNGSATPAQILNTAIDKSADVITDISEGISSGASSVAGFIKYLPFVAVGGVALYIFVIAKSQGKVLKTVARNPRRKR